MNALWRSLITALGARPADPKGGGPGAPEAANATGNQDPARRLSNVPPGSFDRRPVINWATPHGAFCLPADVAADESARAIAEGKPVAAELLELARKHVVPGSVVLDVGAGFGRMSALFSGLTTVNGQVLAFEADQYLCDVLHESIRINHCENVRIFHGAVYDASRTRVSFPAAPPAANAAYSGQRVDPAAAGDGVLQTRTIDDLKIDAPVSFLYIDTNGCELQVMRGAVDTIARFRMPVAFRFLAGPALEFGTTLEALRAFFDPLGYEIDSTSCNQHCIAVPKDYSAVCASRTGQPAATTLAYPNIQAPLHDAHLCKLLQNRRQVDACSNYLKQWGYVPHLVECKDWDLAHIIPAVGDGNFLDMGSSDSYILKNLALKRIRGELYGIDLRAPDVPISNVKYLIGDLMQTPLPDGHFANITCLSVLEHQVDYDKFAAEASRLLAPDGRVFVTFDYWEPKVTPPIKLYGLDWMPLDAGMVRRFISSCAQHDLELVEPFDFTTGDPLIRGDYYSPHPDISYTFGIAVFRKR